MRGNSLILPQRVMRHNAMDTSNSHINSEEWLLNRVVGPKVILEPKYFSKKLLIKEVRNRYATERIYPKEYPPLLFSTSIPVG